MTVSNIMAMNPCNRYPRERVLELWAGRESLSLLEILDLDISEEDRIWVMTQPGVLPDSVLKEFSGMLIERAIQEYCLNCGVPEVEAWARGTDRSEATARALPIEKPLPIPLPNWAEAPLMIIGLNQRSPTETAWAYGRATAVTQYLIKRDPIDQTNERIKQIEDLRQLIEGAEK